MMDPHQLRFKSSLTAQEIFQLCSAAYESALSRGVHFPFSLKECYDYLMFAIRHEVGGFGSPYKTLLSNGTFAGLLQNGVDILVEGNAATRDSMFRKRRPTMWTIFPSGIHRMYTRSNRKVALDFHKSLVRFPRSLEGTAVDPLVAICSFMDTMLWAFKEVESSMKRKPSFEEVYAFHLHGYPLMTNYYRLKAGRKPFNRGANLASVQAKIRKQLAGQSVAARKSIGHIGLS